MKKANLTIEMLTVMVIVVVFLLIMAVYLIRARDHFGAVEDTAPCAAEIKTHAAFAAATGEYMLTDITCPTHVVSVQNDDVEFAKHTIAEEMARCWGIWGRGNLTLFGDEASEAELKGTSGVFCHVCSIISTPQIDEIEGMPQYLAEKPYTDRLNYIEYLTGEERGTYFDDSQFQAHAGDVLTTEKSLGVVYYHYKGQYWTEAVLSATLGNPLGAMLGGAVLIGYVAAAVGSGGSTVAASAAAGGAAGGIGSFFVRPGSDTLSIVYVRPLSEAGIESLNCAYAPVKEG